MDNTLRMLGHVRAASPRVYESTGNDDCTARISALKNTIVVMYDRSSNRFCKTASTAENARL